MLATTVIPLLKWNRLIPRIETERLRWVEIKQDYENALSDSRASGNWIEAKREFHRVRRRDNLAEKRDGVIPKHRDLLVIARANVCRKHGAS
jgi:hypothetical protein